MASIARDLNTEAVFAVAGRRRHAFANNFAVNASLQFSYNNFKFQVSGYASGTVGLNKLSADSLGLDSGDAPIFLPQTV